MPLLSEMIRRRWLDLRGPGVVAVSGGADSVALLQALATWIDPLIVAHLNHRLRGADSDADEQFVRDLCAPLGITCRTLAIDVAAEAERSGENLEDTARRLRYDWLAQIAEETGACWIATGHTADDQAETVLHRLLRGSGIQGLRGIAPQRELRPGVDLIRPQLEATRADVLSYLDALRQPWREDLSNRDPLFTRNRIRHELLPLLRTFNPAIGTVLGRLAEQAGEIHQEEKNEAEILLTAAERPSAGELRIFDMQCLQAAARQRVRGMFRLLWDREGWPLNDMTFEHWKRVVAVAFGEEIATDLPGGISARRRGHVVQIGARICART